MRAVKKTRLELNDSTLQFNVLETKSGQEQLEWKELNLIIEGILKKLPEQQREIMIMRDIDGFEYFEIAEATQLKVEHIRVLLSRARKQVGLELKKNYCYE